MFRSPPKALCVATMLTSTVLVSLLFVAPPAWGASSIAPLPSQGGYSITLYTIGAATAPGNPGSTSKVISPNGTALYPVMFPTVTTNATLFSNTPCIAVYFAYYSNTRQVLAASQMAPQIWYTLNHHYPPCQYRATSITTPAAPPRTTVLSEIQTIIENLPVPKPRMAPNFGLVGVAAYLESGANLADSLSISSNLGEIIAQASGTLYINFGDASPSVGPTSSLGGAWPSGNLLHVYESSGCYAITVTEAWSVSYRIAGSTGVLNGLHTSGEVPSFCVYSTSSVMLR